MRERFMLIRGGGDHDAGKAGCEISHAAGVLTEAEKKILPIHQGEMIMY